MRIHATALARGNTLAVFAPTLPREPELGVISDLDKTIIPPHNDRLPEAAYPGVAALMRELEFQNRGQAGDVYYVTARTPERLNGISAWLHAHGLPAGRIDTGAGGVPAQARAEKVRDILAIMEAHPGQRFVLLGDTSHVDPDVFRDVLAARPGQVAAALVHMVKPITADRLNGLIAFADYREATHALHQRGLIGDRAARRLLTRRRGRAL